VQLILSLTYHAITRFRHLVPRTGKIDYRLRYDKPCLVGHLLQARAIRRQYPQDLASPLNPLGETLR
jgi:hypothetical protein